MKDIQVIVKKNEEKILPFVWINGKEREYSVNVTLTGENANLLIVGIFLGIDTHSVIFNTNVIHKGKNTKSRTMLRGVFLDRSAISNDAMIHIAKGAKGADGYFASKILLFDDAKGRSVPSLEIDENDLKAGHASTIGRPDEQQLFYLRSRGLTEKQAEQLLITGFFAPVIALLPKEQQSKVQKQVEEALKRHAELVSAS